MMEQWEQQLTRECEVRGIANKTTRSYLAKFKMFVDFHKTKDLASLGLEDIKDFILHLQKKLINVVVNTHHVVLTLLFVQLSSTTCMFIKEITQAWSVG